MKFVTPSKNWVLKPGQRISVDMGAFGIRATIIEVKDKGTRVVVEWTTMNGKRMVEEVERARLMV